jgi:hypothetical protein
MLLAHQERAHRFSRNTPSLIKSKRGQFGWFLSSFKKLKICDHLVWFGVPFVVLKHFFGICDRLARCKILLVMELEYL